MVTILIPDVVRGHGSFLNLVLQTVCFFLKKKKKRKPHQTPKQTEKTPTQIKTPLERKDLLINLG